MSKQGSRYGRRSNWFKIHCLLQSQRDVDPEMESLAASQIRPNEQNVPQKASADSPETIFNPNNKSANESATSSSSPPSSPGGSSSQENARASTSPSGPSAPHNPFAGLPAFQAAAMGMNPALNNFFGVPGLPNGHNKPNLMQNFGMNPYAMMNPYVIQSLLSLQLPQLSQAANHNPLSNLLTPSAPSVPNLFNNFLDNQNPLQQQQQPQQPQAANPAANLLMNPFFYATFNEANNPRIHLSNFINNKRIEFVQTIERKSTHSTKRRTNAFRPILEQPKQKKIKR